METKIVLKQFTNLIVLFILMIISILLPTTVFAEVPPDTKAPIISVNKISIVSDRVIVSGQVSDDQPVDQTLTTNLIYPNDVKEPLTVTAGTWSINVPVTVKLNKLQIEAIDSAGNKTTMYIQRPSIKSIKLTVYKLKYGVYSTTTGKIDSSQDITEEINLLDSENVTRVALNSTIQVELSDEINNSITNANSPIVIYDENQVNVPIDVSLTAPGNKINIAPQINQSFKPGQTYYLKFNPSLIPVGNTYGSVILSDDLNHDFFPNVMKFSTVGNTVKDHSFNELVSEEVDDQMPNSQQPHGFFTQNTNVCGICHSTHLGASKSLEKGNKIASSIETGYCMACHDGTSAPKMESPINSTHSKHDTELLPLDSNKTYSEACTACHNPHLTWTKDNPNLLQDYFEYQHYKGDIIEGFADGKVDSRIQPCETCHERNSNYYKNLSEMNYGIDKVSNTFSHDDSDWYRVGEVDMNSPLCEKCHGDKTNIYIENAKSSDPTITRYKHNPADLYHVGTIDYSSPLCESCHKSQTNLYISLAEKGNNQKAYKVLHYQRFTAVGQKESYNLCFNCHNSEKEQSNGIKNIQKYYEDASSKHNIAALDGSPLDGNLPCAECHETHRSTNKLLLKTKLGHENQSDNFTYIDSNWSAGSEREFCLKCHNNSTAIYGKTGMYKTVDSNGVLIDGHQSTDNGRACSFCHSSSYNKNDPNSAQAAALEAAHSPKLGIPSNDK